MRADTKQWIRFLDKEGVRTAFRHAIYKGLVAASMFLVFVVVAYLTITLDGWLPLILSVVILTAGAVIVGRVMLLDHKMTERRLDWIWNVACEAYDDPEGSAICYRFLKRWEFRPDKRAENGTWHITLND